MSFDLPSLSGPIGPVTIDGIPDRFALAVEAPLPPVSADAHVALDPVSADARVALEPVTANARVAVEPLAVEVAVTRLPAVRVHVPADFSLCLCLFGLRILSIHLGGEAQVVTEPYRPNPAEQAVGSGSPTP